MAIMTLDLVPMASLGEEGVTLTCWHCLLHSSIIHLKVTQENPHCCSKRVEDLYPSGVADLF